MQERDDMLDHIEKRPDAMWKSSIWSFRNDAKIYGSPMFDAVWVSNAHASADVRIQDLILHLKAAAVPFPAPKTMASN